MKDNAEVRLSVILASDHRGEALHATEEDAAAWWASALENLTSLELSLCLMTGRTLFPTMITFPPGKVILVIVSYVERDRPYSMCCETAQ